MNILERRKKGKMTLILSIILTFLVTLAVLGSLVLYELEKLKPEMTISAPPPLLQPCPAATTTTGAPILPKLFVASRRGKTYYYPWCTGASTIPEANKIWFESTTSAEAAGYTPAKSCRDLFK